MCPCMSSGVSCILADRLELRLKSSPVAVSLLRIKRWGTVKWVRWLYGCIQRESTGWFSIINSCWMRVLSRWSKQLYGSTCQGLSQFHLSKCPIWHDHMAQKGYFKQSYAVYFYVYSKNIDLRQVLSPPLSHLSSENAADTTPPCYILC